MKLLTKEILKKFPKWMSTDGKPQNEQKIVAKFFNPTGAGTWYAIEFDGEDQFFGYAKIQEGELGYFSLSELQSFKGRFGLGIERDLHWNPNTTLADVIAGKAR